MDEDKRAKRNARAAEWRRNNKDKVAAANKKWREANPERAREFQKSWQQRNQDHVRQKRKEYYDNNKELYADHGIKRRERNPGSDKKYYERRKENRPGEIARYARHRLATDLNFKIKVYLRNRVRAAMLAGSKAGSAVEDLGCTIDQFKAHIASRFADGMSWENYGEWHLDHVVPLARFDLTIRDEFLKAAHYTNYQPLWALENLRKGAKLLEPLEPSLP